MIELFLEIKGIIKQQVAYESAIFQQVSVGGSNYSVLPTSWKVWWPVSYFFSVSINVLMNISIYSQILLKLLSILMPYIQRIHICWTMLIRILTYFTFR